MNTSPSELCPECRKVETYLEIDIKRLLKDLAKYKGKEKELTEQEKQYLCLSMVGYKPIDIAKQNYQLYYNKIKAKNPNLSSEEIEELVRQDIKDRARNISHFLSDTVNQYITDLVSKLDVSLSCKKRPSWLRIICLLKAKGYKKKPEPIQQPSNMKKIIIELKDETDFKKMVEFIEFMKQKFGHDALNFQTIESNEDEDNESQN